MSSRQEAAGTEKSLHFAHKRFVVIRADRPSLSLTAVIRLLQQMIINDAEGIMTAKPNDAQHMTTSV